ncbi:MAG: OsmC family peroxiredoxin [Streptococcaceae bacterium]|jgi:osmotically inducible protein OsmC|nr:OsmC family peroxiredoxin [Streptococcaceae bacterium]
MANTSKASAKWAGALETGKGTINADTSGLFTDAPYDFKARLEGSNSIVSPEELLGAAHAACFSMAFSLVLGQEKGIAPKSIETRAEVTFDVTDAGPAITGIKLINKSWIDGLTEAEFQEIANVVKENCPVSKALKGVDITLEATLVA